jgi:hypothetical protein
MGTAVNAKSRATTTVQARSSVLTGNTKSKTDVTSNSSSRHQVKSNSIHKSSAASSTIASRMTKIHERSTRATVAQGTQKVKRSMSEEDLVLEFGTSQMVANEGVGDFKFDI